MKQPIRFAISFLLALWFLTAIALSSASDKAMLRGAGRRQGQGATQAKPSKALEEVALRLVSQQQNLQITDLVVDNSAIATYSYSGKKANVFSITDSRTDKAYQIALDDKGQVIDQTKLAAEDLAARVARYGKLSPYLWERLQQASPDEDMTVTVQLNMSPDTDAPRDEPSIDSEKLKKMTPQERRDLNQKEEDFERRLQAYNALRAQRAVGPVVERLKQLGYDPTVLGNTGFLTLKIGPQMIRQMETWPEVREISSEPNLKPSGSSATFLDISRPMVGADLVENRGINGQNVTVAQVEVGGRIFNALGGSNPFLSGSQDNSFICADPNDHSVAVAGILISSAPTNLQPVYRGVCPGAHLIATGSCLGDPGQLQTATQNAIGLGATALNHSYGADTGNFASNPVNALDRFLDARVFTDHVVQVVAAGNESDGCGTGTDNVDSPAKAYNVTTVGNVNDFESVNWNNAQMDPCSSFISPDSANGDRRKPEVVAPGTLIDTTLAQQHLGQWFGDHFANGGAPISGTSFATPHVTGEATLIISRGVTTFGLNNFYHRPELVKAITLASADHAFFGIQGIGGISAVWADDIVGGTFGGFGHARLGCAALPLQLALIPLQAGVPARVVICWSTDPNYVNYFNQPSADLGLRIRDPAGNVVALADSFDNTYEFFDFTPQIGGNYSIIIRSRRCDEDPGLVAYAFWQLH